MQPITRTLFLALLMCLISTRGVAAGTPKAGEFEVNRITQHVYVLSYIHDAKTRSNIGAVIGNDGVLLLNTYMGAEAKKLETALASITDKPVKYVINSNYDWWSTGANRWFLERGATLIAHSDTVFMTRTESQLLFEDSLSLDVGTEQLAVWRSGGHSYGHVNIYLKQANLVWLADSYSPTWMTTWGPEGLPGYTQGLESAIAKGNADTRFVAGSTEAHKLTLYRADDLKTELALRRAFYQRAATLIKAGQSNDQIAADNELNELMSYYSNPYGLKIASWLVDPVRFFMRAEQHPVNQAEASFLMGRYRADNGAEIEIVKRGKGLVARAKGWFIAPMASGTVGEFHVDIQNLKRTLRFKQENGVASLVFSLGEKEAHYLSALDGQRFVLLKEDENSVGAGR